MAKRYRLSFNCSNMAQQNQENPSFTTPLSDPHFNLSAYTFAVHTLPFNNIYFVLDLLAHDDAATQNFLVLDQINQTIVGLEQQLDENHRLAAQHFLTLLQWQAAQHLPQRIHDAQNPNCGCCQLRCQQPTPFKQTISSLTLSSSSSSPSPSIRFHPYPGWTAPTPSTSQMAPFFPPPLTTRSGRVYPQNYLAERVEDCLHWLQTIPEEWQQGTRDFLIVVEDPEVDDDVFIWYYHWFINEGQD